MARFDPFDPLKRDAQRIALGVLKQVTVPGGKGWICAGCGRAVEPGEKAAKIGKVVICGDCVTKGR